MVIIISFCVFDRINYMTLCASLIGVTSLIFNAKGNPFGQLLIRAVIPINLLLLLILVHIVYVLIRWYVKGCMRSRGYY